MKNGFLIFLIFFLCCALPAAAQSERAAKTEVSDETGGKAPKYEAQLNFSVERLTGDFGTWRSASVYVQRKFDNKQIVWANYRVSERRRVRDQEFIFGVYKPFSKKWAFTGEAMYSPTSRYVGRFSVMGEAEKIFKKGFVAHVGGRFTKYTNVKAVTGYGLVEKYWGSNRAAYTLYVTKLSNAGTAPTHRLQYNRYYGERLNSIGAAVAFGREHENLGPEIGILRNDTWSVSFSARHWLTDKVGINIDGTIHRQGNLYYRRGLSFGLRFRF
jgi:YaiO family outer membrane protein